MFRVALLAQLIVPLLVIADLVTAWRINESPWWLGFGTTGQAAFFVCSLWIVVVLGLFFLGHYTRLFSLARLQGPLVAGYSIIFAIVMVELFLQFAPFGSPEPALWPPSRQALFTPDPDLLPGVQGTSRFTGNSVGLRGPELPQATDGSQIYRIVTVGGSTTESLYLDDSEEWPHLIMEGLNSAQNRVQAWVGNGGQSGRNAVDHLELMRRLPIVAEADLLIFLVGINDLQPILALEGKATQEILESNSEEFGRQILRGGGYPRPTFPIFKRLEIFNRLKASSAATVARFAPSSALSRFGVGPGNYVEFRRNMRAEGPTAQLPDLQLGLQEYRQRVRSLDRECKTNGNRCLFLTQPTMWRNDLNDKEIDLLWFGWVGREFDPVGYLTPSDAAAAMDAYNLELLNVCQQDGLECLDLAAMIPKDVTSFYDDTHFNESGARSVASSVTDYLLLTPPFLE